MFLKSPKASTDPRLRSLLQKAVRRGYLDVSQKVARHLQMIGDQRWLRSRTVVITFEECWPLAENLELSKDPESKYHMLNTVTLNKKYKDAASLGAMSYAYQQGDQVLAEVIADSEPLRIIASGLDDRQRFFSAMQHRCSSERSAKILRAAETYYPAATWPWDQACILAGGYLAVSGAIPETVNVIQTGEPFPFWVALDKHTPEGKAILQEAALRKKIPYRQLIWASFYFESAIVNELGDSPWWNLEKAWRFKKAGLSQQSAEEMWLDTRDLISRLANSEANALREIVAKVNGPSVVSYQPELF